MAGHSDGRTRTSAAGLPDDHRSARVQHELPLSSAAAHRAASRHDPKAPPAVLLLLDVEDVRADLAARRLSCPSCRSGRLAPWAHARTRVVSMLGGRRVRLTPPRARCTDCGRTQVLLPAWYAPRRAHGVEVIATALGGRLRGQGHRVIAEELDVAADTVRGWSRRVSARAEQLRCSATLRLYDLDPSAVPAEPSGSVLADALSALAATVGAARRRLGWNEPGLVWALIGQLGLVRHLAPARGG